MAPIEHPEPEDEPTDPLERAWSGEGERAEARRKGLFERMRKGLPQGIEVSDPASQQLDLKPDVPAPPNDLRSYLRRKAALQHEARSRGPRRMQSPRPKAKGSVGPVLRSIESVLGQISSRSTGDAPRAVLVVPISRDLDATEETISLARMLSRRERAILVDATRGAAAVSGLLGLPRSPGFTDLTAGRAEFADVVQADDETPLQVIPAGNPHVTSEEDQERAARIVTALSQVYDRLVVHIDRETLRKLEPALHGRLQLVVAIVGRGDNINDNEVAVSELTAFGCPVAPFEQPGGEHRPRRSGFFGRAAAV